MESTLLVKYHLNTWMDCNEMLIGCLHKTTTNLETQNVNNSGNFTDTELMFGVTVAESQSQHGL